MLKINNISVRYADGNQALRELSFELQEGETLGIIGANGSGKSTLLMSIVGFLTPTEGTIEIDGQRVIKRNLVSIREKVGLVFQNPEDQLFMSNVYDDIAFGLRNYGMEEEIIRTKITNIMNLLGISDLSNKNSGKLSGGEKRMVALAEILVMEPSVVMFDEPTSFLDPGARRRFINLLGTLSMAKLITTHDMDMAYQICSRVVVLKKGKLFAQGRAKEILSDRSLMEEAGLELPLCLQ
jgi:cobalt/nickel transport system ATP-binding protein